MSDLDEEEVQATREMKQINKIIAPEEKSADEMFEELGYEEIAKKLSLLKDNNCHWQNCKCVENNIKLRLDIIKLKKHCRKLIKEKQELTSAVENSISEDKIREKIKHYEELLQDYIEKYDETNDGIEGMINVLKELLGDSNEKKL